MLSHLRRSSLAAAGLALGAVLLAGACKTDKPAATSSSTPAASGQAAGGQAASAEPGRAAPDYRFGPPGGYKRPAPERTDEVDGRHGGQRRAERLAAFDTDGDGQLSDAEREQMKAERMAQREAHQAEILAENDTDKDGTLSDAERTAMRTKRADAMFGRLDGDGDGKITAAEMEASGGRRGGVRNFAEADADGDGALTKAELEAARASRVVRRGRPDGAGEPAPE
jgi:hypothetical protein